MNKDRICLVCQRYGADVNGGAEQHCRFLAEHMAKYMQVDVVTTKAVDYTTWANEYETDSEWINGVLVRRFPVEQECDIEEFRKIDFKKLNLEEQEDWIDKQGPYTPKLIEYIRNHKDDYKAFIFFTYLFYPTVRGLPEVSDKSIFIPLAHSEDQLDINIFAPIFNMPRAFFFNTEKERDLVRGTFRNYGIPYKIGGVGVDLPDNIDTESFKEKNGLDRYVVYMGRINEDKNVKLLMDFFIRYKQYANNDVKLVLAGKNELDIPNDKDIIYLGFIDDSEKFALIDGCEILIQPSKYESLSMVLLEAFSLKKPVIVNKECDVLKEHCDVSNGGLYFDDYESFSHIIDKLLNNADLRKEYGENGFKYVNDNYSWSKICNKLCHLIDKI